MNRLIILTVLLAAATVVAGCSQKDPAARAIDASEDALAAVHVEAQKYIPGDYAEVKATLDEARQAFAAGNYAEAIQKAQQIPARATALGEKAIASRDALHAELKVEWERLGAELPGLLDGLEARFGELDKARRLPEGVTRDALDRVGKGIPVARNAWNEAVTAYEAGNLEGAAARGGESDRLVRELMTELAMTPPATGGATGD